MLRLWIWLAMVLVAVSGCAPKADEVVEEGEKSVDSWGKTLEMVCGQWAEYRVPTLYVKQTLKVVGTVGNCGIVTDLFWENEEGEACAVGDDGFGQSEIEVHAG